MNYNFDQDINRKETNSLKWDITPGELPLWVADMDFATAPEIQEALQERLDKKIFGYSIIPDTWSQSYIDWWKSRHNFTIAPETLIFCTGVVPAISSAVRKLTTPAEKVVVLTPVYNIFFNSIRNNGRVITECPLDYDKSSNTYSINFTRLEETLSDPQVTLMIFCNPHNPVGKIWRKEELSRTGELCAKHGVTVISDEIHCDITSPGTSYIPFASASSVCSRISITCIAPTKTFNLAGLQTAAVMVPDPILRHKMWRALNTDEVAEPNAFAVQAAEAAFTKGAPWLDALRSYIEENKKTAHEFLAQKIPALKPVPSQATYLLWVDCSALTDDTQEFCTSLRKKTGLWITPGEEYGDTGKGFVRINIACPAFRLNDALSRLHAFITSRIQDNSPIS